MNLKLGGKTMSILNIDDFIAKMQNKEVSTSPFEDLRNESAQKKNYGRRIPFLKKEKNAKIKLLPLKSIAFPFDPFAVEVTDEYNEENKFRTEFSAETMMLAFKKYYNGNPEAKEKFMKKAKVASWDTENVEELNKTDIDAFAEFTVPYIFTLPLVHVNNKIVTGNANGADYKVDIKRNEVGAIVDSWTDKEGQIHDTPKFIKDAMELANFFTSMALDKYNEWARTEGANKTDDDKLKYKMNLMSESPISEDRPKNYLLCYALSMTDDLVLDEKTILEMEPKDYAKHLCLVNYSKDVRTTVEGFSGTYKRKNVYPGFYEIDVIVPDIENKQDRGKETKWNNADLMVSGYENSQILNSIRTNTSAYLDSIKDIDKIFLGSSYVSPYSNEIHEALLKNISETVDPNKLNLTEGIATRFAGMITDIWGAKAASIMSDLAMGELKEGEEISQDELNKNRLELSNALQDETDLDEVNLVEEE